MSPATKRVYLHIGAPKTGTTYLQDVLFRNRSALAEQGVLVPGGTPAAHYEAVLDLRGLAFGGYRDPRAEGAWTELVEQVAQWHGRAAVISHELLSGASDEAMARAVESFAGSEVHVIYTARDLGRQVPAMWQESVKNGQELSFGTYLRRLTSRKRRGRAARIFWRQQHVIEVLKRWAEHVPDERLHVVLVPAPGEPADVLWQRFAGVLDVVTDGFDLDVQRSNVSLGWAEAELLRRVNIELDDDLAWPEYGPTVKFWFAEQVLAGSSNGPRASVPASMHRWLERQAAQITAELVASGWDVVGDLSDLHPGGAAQPGAAVEAGDALDSAPDADADLEDEDEADEADEDETDTSTTPGVDPDDAVVLDAATRALGVLLEERARLLGRRGAGPRAPRTTRQRLIEGAARARQLWRRRRAAARSLQS